MSRKLAFTNEDQVVIKDIPGIQDLTDAEYISMYQNLGFNDVIIVDNIPPIEYQCAWEITNGNITINIDKAKGCKLEILQKEIDLQLSKLNVKYLKTIANDKISTSVKDRIKYLSDLPDIVNSKTTFEDIQNVVIGDWVEPDISELPMDTSTIPKMFTTTNESETSTTSSQYVQKLRLNFTPETDNYFVWFYGEVYTSNRSKPVKTRIQINDTETIHESSRIPMGWKSFSGEYIKHFTAGSHFIDLDVAAEGNSVSIRRARLFVTKIVL